METNHPYEHYYWQNDKVRLRLWEPKDGLAAAADDWDSQGWMLVHEEVTLPPQRRQVETQSDVATPQTDAPAFTIENLAGEYIGHIHFNYINERHGTFSIGMILSRPQRGRGYGTAAMRLLLAYAFEERRLNKFGGFCLDDNIASARMMEALGCVREGVSREVVFLHGRYHDQYLYGLTATEYFAQKNRL